MLSSCTLSSVSSTFRKLLYFSTKASRDYCSGIKIKFIQKVESISFAFKRLKYYTLLKVFILTVKFLPNKEIWREVIIEEVPDKSGTRRIHRVCVYITTGGGRGSDSTVNVSVRYAFRNSDGLAN